MNPSNFIKLSSKSNGNNFSFNGQQRNNLFINKDEYNANADMKNYIDQKFEENNRIHNAIIGMIRTIRDDQKQIIQGLTTSQLANENNKHDREFLNNYYATNGKADEIFRNLMLQPEFSQLKQYQ